MTREEARLTLQENFGLLSFQYPGRITEALKVAIEALSQPSLPSDLGEAAKEYLRQYNESEYGNGGDDWDDDICITFKAGAEWMAGQGASFNTKVGWIDGPTILDWPDDILDKFEMGDEVIVQIRKKQ